MFSTSSNLTASDHWLKRDDRTGLVKNGLFRRSKQDMAEDKMFHSGKPKGMKKFSLTRKLKGMSKGKAPRFSHGEYHTSGVGPSRNEFDKMMKSSVTHNPNKKESFFTRKKFG
jgi:hypothetical protein